MSQQLVNSPFKGKGNIVLQYLLAEPNRHWRGHELAELSQVSLAWVNRILQTLELEGIVQRSGRGPKGETSLINAKKLIQWWLASYSFKRHKTHLYLDRDEKPLKTTKKLAQLEGFQYAITGFSAANLIEPVVYHMPPMIYLWPPVGHRGSYRSFLARLENIHQLIPVKKAANLIFVEPSIGPAVFTRLQTLKGYQAVSPLQLYLDLVAISDGRFVVDELAAYWKEQHIPYEV